MDPEIIVATSSNTSSINIYDLASATPLASLKNNKSDCNAVCVSLDSSSPVIYSTQNDKALIHLWNWNKESLLGKHVVPEKLSCCSVSGNGQLFLGASHTGKLYLWNVESGELLCILEAHFKRIGSTCFTSDGQGFVSGSDDAMVKFYLLSDALSLDRRKSTVGPTWTWSDHSLSVTQVCTSPGSTAATAQCFSASLDRTCKIRDLSSGTVLLSILFPMPLTSIAIDPLERWIIAGGQDGNLAKAHLYTMEKSMFTKIPTDNQMDWIVMFPKSHQAAIRSVALNIVGSLLVSSGDDAKICVSDVSSLQVLRTIDLEAGKCVQVLITEKPDNFMEPAKSSRGTELVPFKREKA